MKARTNKEFMMIFQDIHDHLNNCSLNPFYTWIEKTHSRNSRLTLNPRELTFRYYLRTYTNKMDQLRRPENSRTIS